MPEIRYDVIELKAEVSPEGWIRDKPVVTRAGIFKYRTQDGKLKSEYRPDSEVFTEQSLNTLAGIPVTDGHRGLIGRDNVVGIVGTVLSPGAKQDQDVIADLIIHDANKLGKKRELSLGYICDVDETPGEWNGEKYDSIQKNIIYNHLAVVNKGRAGNAKLRLDHDDAASFPFDMEEDTMADPKLSVLRLDNLEYPAAPEVVNAYTKSKDDLVALQKRFDTIEAERDSLNVKLVDANKLVDAVKAGARSELKARLELESIATTHGIKFDQDDGDRSVREKILTKLNPNLKFDGKSDDYVDSAFDIAMTYENDKKKKVSLQIKKFDTTTEPANSGSVSSIDARAKMIARIRGEKQEVA